MNKNYHSIYLAPHLDDAVLSCGGQIFEETQRGKRTLVVTVMAGDPGQRLSTYAAGLHNRWALAQNATAERRREDQIACALLGAETRHWQFPDCIYRVDPAGGAALYRSDDDIFGPIHPVEQHLVDDVARQLTTLPGCHRIVAPLTVGNHVDHQITRRAADHVFGRRLAYYEDYPYVQTAGSLDFLHADAPTDKFWTETVVPVSKAALEAKIEAILSYQSQLSTFFEDQADLEHQVIGYARGVGGERVWRCQPATISPDPNVVEPA